MGRWFRMIPFSADHEQRRVECWEYHRSDVDKQSFQVEVRVGKTLDVQKLKGTELRQVRDYSKYLQKTATRLYGPSPKVESYSLCKVCQASIPCTNVEMRIFGVAYVRCKECGHVEVGHHLEPDELSKIFSESEEHSTPYVDREAVEVRMSEVIEPKIEWCLENYSRFCGGSPRKVVDIGAGGGHFLAGVMRKGLEVEGFEKSRTSRAFAKEAFGLELFDEEFADTNIEPADLVTFWGMLEYAQEPREFLSAARKRIAPDGMLVIEVPRADCLGSLIQAQENSVVARHMDPTSHLNAFSDESLCTALVEEGFAPVSVWYFGMDAYEVLVQGGLRLGDERLVEKLAEMVPVIQKAADRGRQCDDMVIAAVPVTR